jgi:hypothetical protein
MPARETCRWSTCAGAALGAGIAGSTWLSPRRRLGLGADRSVETEKGEVFLADLAVRLNREPPLSAIAAAGEYGDPGLTGIVAVDADFHIPLDLRRQRLADLTQQVIVFVGVHQPALAGSQFRRAFVILAHAREGGMGRVAAGPIEANSSHMMIDGAGVGGATPATIPGDCYRFSRGDGRRCSPCASTGAEGWGCLDCKSGSPPLPSVVDPPLILVKKLTPSAHSRGVASYSSSASSRRQSEKRVSRTKARASGVPSGNVQRANWKQNCS